MRVMLLLAIIFGCFPVLAQIQCVQAQRVSFFNSFINNGDLPVSFENTGFGYEPVITVSVGTDSRNNPILQVGNRSLLLQDGPLIVNDMVTKGRIEANIQQISSNMIQVSNRIYSQGDIPLMNVRRNIVVTLSVQNQELTRLILTTFPSARMVVNGQSVETPINESKNEFTFTRSP